MATTAVILHPGTLVFAISMFGFLMAGIAMSAATAMPDHRPALVMWSRSMLGAGCGFLLYLIRGHAPWFLTLVVANVLVIGCAAYGHMAFARLLGFAASRGVVITVSALAMSGVLAIYGFEASLRVGVFTVSSGIATLLGMTGRLLGKRAVQQPTAPLIIGAVVTLAMSAGFTIRAFAGAFGDGSSVPPAGDSHAQVGVLLMGAVFVVISSISFFAVMHEQQRLAILQGASRDGLTGVLTRAAFFKEAAQLEKNASRPRYAVVMLDLDHFKNINDTHGHAAGDIILAHAGRLLCAAVRLSDVVGRYGGEEFSILLRDCNEEQVASLAQRIIADAARQAVRMPDGQSLSYTLSAGYALSEACDPEPFRDVIERADRALFRAKREGRNRALSAAPRRADVLEPRHGMP